MEIPTNNFTQLFNDRPEEENPIQLPYRFIKGQVHYGTMHSRTNMPEGSTNRDKRRAKRADGVTNDLLNDRLKTRLINQVTSFLSGSQNNPEMTVAILCTYERISKELDLEIPEGLGILLSEVNPEERYYFNQTYQHYANNQIDRGISVLNWPVYEDIEANLEA